MSIKTKLKGLFNKTPKLLVVKTDKGYLKGDIYSGVSFVKKKDARTFTETEAGIYADSISADLFQFYGCKRMQFKYK